MLGSLLVAATLIGILIWHLRHRAPTGRLSSHERKLVASYLASAMDDILRALPLPSTPHDQYRSYRGRLAAKAAYIPAPFIFREKSPKWQRQPTTGRGDASLLCEARAARSCSTIILGDAGTGKSLIAALAFATLADKFLQSNQSRDIPVFLRLNLMATTSGHEYSADDFPLEVLPPKLRLLGDERLTSLIRADALVLVLDGLDELGISGAPRHHIGRLPPILLPLLHRRRFVITCRDAFHKLYVDTDRLSAQIDAEITLRPFDYEAHVIPFVQEYCRANNASYIAQQVLDIVSSHPVFLEILSRPLMLAMSVDVLCEQIKTSGAEVAAQALKLTGSDYLGAQIYEWYVEKWIGRELAKGAVQSLPAELMLGVVGHTAWAIFTNPTRVDTGYGAFDIQDLLISYANLEHTGADWLQHHPGANAQTDLPTLITCVTERTFLIVNHGGESYRFVHKSFFEYMLARHVHSRLADPHYSQIAPADLLSSPLPDEVIDFLRELLHRSVAEAGAERAQAESTLLAVVQQTAGEPSKLMARQQAANLLPIVANGPTHALLNEMVSSDAEHPFVKRAIGVGYALHHANSRLLDHFVQSMDTDADALDFHMGYNRIYYGDQPLSRTDFRDDLGEHSTRFFRACVRHLQLDQ
ncbi:MAG TPA: hypothetical protein VFU36_06310, partial [Jatrophihabitans sp.]|nr:hypothetical protein [Jatrophihabitans sp.]